MNAMTSIPTMQVAGLVLRLEVECRVTMPEVRAGRSDGGFGPPAKPSGLSVAVCLAPLGSDVSDGTGKAVVSRQPLPVPLRRQHRGVFVEDLPGRGAADKAFRFALFKRGLWPPKNWAIPADLEGPELAVRLRERAKRSNKPVGRSVGEKMEDGG